MQKKKHEQPHCSVQLTHNHPAKGRSRPRAAEHHITGIHRVPLTGHMPLQRHTPSEPFDSKPAAIRMLAQGCSCNTIIADLACEINHHRMI